MEIKKSPKASLENKKTLFREIGLVLSLLIVLGAFEWSTTEQSEIEGFEDTQVVVEEEQVPITQEEQLPPPEAPKEPVFAKTDDISHLHAVSAKKRNAQRILFPYVPYPEIHCQT